MQTLTSWQDLTATQDIYIKEDMKDIQTDEDVKADKAIELEEPRYYYAYKDDRIYSSDIISYYIHEKTVQLTEVFKIKSKYKFKHIVFKEVIEVEGTDTNISFKHKDSKYTINIG